VRAYHTTRILLDDLGSLALAKVDATYTPRAINTLDRQSRLVDDHLSKLVQLESGLIAERKKNKMCLKNAPNKKINTEERSFRFPIANWPR